jgi:hypothetical protein
LNDTTQQANERLVQLINAERDGELDAAGREELDAILECSSDARALRSEWQKVFNLLDSVPDEEPPVAIASRIVGPGGPVHRQRSTSWSRLFSLRRLAPVGMGFATGLLVTVAAYEIVAPSTVPGLHNAVGTAGIAQRRETLDSATLAGPVIRGEVALQAVSDGLVLEVDLEAESDFTIGMDHPGFTLKELEFDGQPTAPDQAVTMNAASQHLAVSGEGKQAFSVFLTRADAPSGDGVAIRVATNGKIVYSGVLGGR